MRNKFYYGYLSTFLACLTIFGSYGLLTSCMGNFIATGIIEKGWNAAIVGLAYSMRLFPVALSPLVGWTLAKFGPRRTIFWSTLLTSVVIALSGYFDSAWGFVFGFGLAVGISMYFNDNLACITVVNNWWESRRGQMSSLLMTFSYVGGVVFPVLVSHLLDRCSWRDAMWLCAITLFVLTALPQFLWMKDHPEEVGQTMEEGVKPVKRAVPVQPSERTDWTVKEAVKTPQLWLIGVLYGCICTPYIIVMNYAITHFQLNGMASLQATSFVPAMNVTTLVFTLFIGMITDRLGIRKSFILAFVMGAIGVVSVLFVTPNYLTWILPLLCCPFPMSMGLPLVTMSVGSYYGRKHFSAIWGCALPVTSLMTVWVSPLIGLVLQTTGSLVPIFIGGGIYELLCILPTLFLRPPKHRSHALPLHSTSASGDDNSYPS